MKTLTNWRHIDALFLNNFFNLRRFVIRKLPGLNEEIEAKTRCPITFAQMANEPIKNLLVYDEYILNSDYWSEHTIIPFSFIISSIFRHFETFGIKISPWKILPHGTEDLMTKIGEKLKIPPRDSSYTTWLWNRKYKFRFDQSKSSRLFHKAVIKYDDQCLQNNLVLRDIIRGTIKLESAEAIECFKQITLSVQQIFDLWKTFMEKDQNGILNITPEYFAFVYRTYFLTYKISGKEWHGTNAANVPSGISFDLLMGVDDIYYRNSVVPLRMVHFTSIDKNTLFEDLQSSNILDLFMEKINLHSALVEHMDIELLKKISIIPSDVLKQVFEEYCKSIDKWSSLFSMHLGMINNYLTKTMKKYENGICPLGFHNPVVDPSMGTGSMTHEETKRLSIMRRANPEIIKLKKIILDN